MGDGGLRSAVHRCEVAVARTPASCGKSLARPDTGPTRTALSLEGSDHQSGGRTGPGGGRRFTPARKRRAPGAPELSVDDSRSATAAITHINTAVLDRGCIATPA